MDLKTFVLPNRQKKDGLPEHATTTETSPYSH